LLIKSHELLVTESSLKVAGEAISGDRGVECSATGAANKVPSGEHGGATDHVVWAKFVKESSAGRRQHQAVGKPL